MKNMNEQEKKYSKKILEVIKRHLGKENAIKVEDLMDIVPLNDREIRRVVQYLVNVKQYPIGSTTNSPYGFYMIINIEDYLEAVKNLSNRKSKLIERIQSLREACLKRGISVPRIEVNTNDGSQIVNISNSIVIYLK